MAMVGVELWMVAASFQPKLIREAKYNLNTPKLYMTLDALV